jgi:hypothetical protein
MILMKTNRTIDGRIINQARHRRQGAFVRRHVCVLLGAPLDSCYTTGELCRDLKLAGREHDVARIEAEALNVL